MTHIASILLAALLLMPDAKAQTFMTGDEVAKALIGNTAQGSMTTPSGTTTEYTVFATPDGKMRMRQVTKSLSQNITTTGQWQVHGGQFCYHMQRDIMWNCYKFQRLGEDRIAMSDGISPARIELVVRKGNVAKL